MLTFALDLSDCTASPRTCCAPPHTSTTHVFNITTFGKGFLNNVHIYINSSAILRTAFSFPTIPKSSVMSVWSAELSSISVTSLSVRLGELGKYFVGESHFCLDVLEALWEGFIALCGGLKPCYDLLAISTSTLTFEAANLQQLVYVNGVLMPFEPLLEYPWKVSSSLCTHGDPYYSVRAHQCGPHQHRYLNPVVRCHFRHSSHHSLLQVEEQMVFLKSLTNLLDGFFELPCLLPGERSFSTVLGVDLMRPFFGAPFGGNRD